MTLPDTSRALASLGMATALFANARISSGGDRVFFVALSCLLSVMEITLAWVAR